MPTRFSKALTDYAPLLNSLYGKVDDLVSYDNYGDFLRALVPKEKMHGDFTRHEELRDKILGSPLEDTDYYNSGKKLDTANPELANSSAYLRWQEYKNQNSAAGSQEPQMSFEDFYASDPVLKGEIESKYLVDNNTPRTVDEIKQLQYKKAGLSDEDIEFYENYKPPYHKDYNRGLQNLLFESMPALQSSGEQGNKLAQMFGTKVDSLMMGAPKETEYGVSIDEKGKKFVYYDKNNPGNFKSVSYGEPDKETPAYKPLGIKQDTDGKYIVYGSMWSEEKQEFVDVKLKDANEEEIQKYELNKQKMTKTGPFAPKKTGSKGKGGLNFNAGKLSTDQLSKMTPDKLEGMSPDDLRSLNKNKRFLSPEMQKALEEKMGDDIGVDDGGLGEDTETGVDSTGGDAGPFDFSGSLPEMRAVEGEEDDFMGMDLNEYHSETNQFESEVERGDSAEGYDENWEVVNEANTELQKYISAINNDPDNAQANIKAMYEWMGQNLYNQGLSEERIKDYYDQIDAFVAQL